VAGLAQLLRPRPIPPFCSLFLPCSRSSTRSGRRASFFYGFTKDFSSPDRVKIAALVGFYSLLIMFGALWASTYILSFFGVSIDAHAHRGAGDGDRS